MRIAGIGIILIITVGLAITGCERNDPLAEGPQYKLSFSTDTLLFDTVFTTVGSTTRTLTIYNPNDRKIRVSSIRLAGGSSSPFDLNIDGDAVTEIKDVEIEPGDSLFAFVRVTVDPTNANSPLVITDSLVMFTNGNQQVVRLVAWGQDAHFFVGNKKLEGLSYKYLILAGENETVEWIDDKPYVIYGWGVVDSSARLIIGPGCNIHFHQNSGLWVYRYGSIQVNGLPDSIVTFEGDRLDYAYRELPGQWDRIWINEGSVDNEFHNVLIKNGFIGLQAEITSEDAGNALILENTTVRNMSRWGLFTIGYRVIAGNSVFANCSEQTAFLTVGGNYDFRHCTFAGYWNSSVRLEPSVVVSNNLTYYNADGQAITLLGDLYARFGNCLITGNLDEELQFSNDASVQFDLQFDHCGLTTLQEFSDPLFVNCFRNPDPKFVNVQWNNYRLDTLSAAINKGLPEIVTGGILDLTLDADGNSRMEDEAPDLGAYEFIPEGSN
ncbi:MAG: hypothetical protein Kow00127_03650 [Bacteroidales bacterium]